MPTSIPIDPVKTHLEREYKHTSPAIACRFDPTGRFLFLAAQDNTIQRYDLLTGVKTTLKGHQSWVRGLAFVPTAGHKVVSLADWQGMALLGGSTVLTQPRPQAFTLISGDYHGKLVWWQGDIDQPVPMRTLDAHDGWARAVAVSPDGKTVASCGNDNLVKLWSTSDGKLLQTLRGHDSHVYNVAFHPTENRLVSGDLKGIVKDWDLAKGEVVRELDAKVLHKFDAGFVADIGGIRAIAFDATGSRLACAGITNVSNAFAGVGNPLVVVFDWKEGKPKQFKPKETFQGTAWGVAYHPQGYLIAAGGGGQGRIWFWKGDEPTSMHTLTVPSNSRDMAYHPDGVRIAVACFDGSAKVYAMIPGKAVAAPPPPKKK